MILKISKTLFLFLFVSILFIQCVQAQSIFKGLNVDNSTFLLGATNARKSQCLYKPTDFSTLPFNGEITKIYYRYGSTGNTAAHDLSPFTIKLGQTTDTIFPVGNTFFTGLNMVRYDSIFTIPAGVQGDWFGIDLQTPFVYDSSKTLIVEIQFYNTTASNFGTLGNSNTTQKLISADTAALAQTGFGSTTWQDFGFDYLITTGLATINTANDFTAYPNPTSDKININNLYLKNNGIISIYDLFGKCVYSFFQNKLNTSATIDMSIFEQGVYFIKIESKDTNLVKKVVKM